MDYERITIDPAKMRGVPCIRGLTHPRGNRHRSARRRPHSRSDPGRVPGPRGWRHSRRLGVRSRGRSGTGAPAHPPGVRFLVDANVSPDVARLLTAAGHDAVAVRLRLQDAPDDEILDRALGDDRIIISHDTDFGTLFARVASPSLPSSSFVRLIRHHDADRSHDHRQPLHDGQRPHRRRHRHLCSRTAPLAPPPASLAGVR